MTTSCDRLGPHSFYARDKKTTIWSHAANADGGVGGDVNAVVAATSGDGGTDGTESVADADANASKSLRNYACYNYYPRIYHRRQGVVLNCMMALCLAIVLYIDR